MNKLICTLSLIHKCGNLTDSFPGAECLAFYWFLMAEYSTLKHACLLVFDSNEEISADRCYYKSVINIACFTEASV